MPKFTTLNGNVSRQNMALKLLLQFYLPIEKLSQPLLFCTIRSQSKAKIHTLLVNKV